MLNSPHYGERWDRHWLGVVGFAESSLFIDDQVKPRFWRYGDCFIRAFKADKPNDRFLTERLAGDELFDWRAPETSGPRLQFLFESGLLERVKET